MELYEGAQMKLNDEPWLIQITRKGRLFYWTASIPNPDVGVFEIIGNGSRNRSEACHAWRKFAKENGIKDWSF